MSRHLRLVCHCDRCGHEWIAQVPQPSHCAKCRSRQWDKPAEKEQEQEREQETSMQTAEQLYTAYRASIPATLGDPTPQLSWPTWNTLPAHIQAVWEQKAMSTR